MKVYRNPFVSRESYFVKTGAAKTGRAEASASKGFSVDFVNGKWEVREATYYDISLRDEMPVVAENKVSIKSVIHNAVRDVVLGLVDESKNDKESDVQKGDFVSLEKVKEKMIKYGFTAPDMTVTEFVEDELPVADVEPVRPLAEVVEDPRTYPGESRANYGCTACRRILGTWKKGLTFEQLPNFCCWCGAEFTDGGVKSEL